MAWMSLEALQAWGAIMRGLGPPKEVYRGGTVAWS